MAVVGTPRIHNWGLFHQIMLFHYAVKMAIRVK